MGLDEEEQSEVCRTYDRCSLCAMLFFGLIVCFGRVADSISALLFVLRSIDKRCVTEPLKFWVSL